MIVNGGFPIQHSLSVISILLVFTQFLHFCLVLMGEIVTKAVSTFSCGWIWILFWHICFPTNSESSLLLLAAAGTTDSANLMKVRLGRSCWCHQMSALTFQAGGSKVAPSVWDSRVRFGGLRAETEHFKLPLKKNSEKKMTGFHVRIEDTADNNDGSLDQYSKL